MRREGGGEREMGMLREKRANTACVGTGIGKVNVPMCSFQLVRGGACLPCHLSRKSMAPMEHRRAVIKAGLGRSVP